MQAASAKRVLRGDDRVRDRLETGVGQRGLGTGGVDHAGRGTALGDHAVVVQAADLGEGEPEHGLEHVVGVHAEERCGRGRPRWFGGKAQRRRRGAQRPDARMVDVAEHRVRG